MKPEQFIREFGVDKAREALTLCCWMDGSFCTRLWHGCVQNNHECCVDVKDLKRLVESVAFVIEHYTVERAKIYANSPYTAPEVKQALERAIADYESIYGGGDD